MTKSLDTNSFILALRHFIASGEVKTIRCNNGSNFVRPERELAKSIGEMDQQKISEYLLERKTDWIVWKKNPVFLSSLASLHER